MKTKALRLLAVLCLALVAGAAPTFALDVTAIRAEVEHTLESRLDQARAEQVMTEIEQFVASWVVAATNADGRITELGLDGYFDRELGGLFEDVGLAESLEDLKTLVTDWASAELDRVLVNQ